MAQTLRSQDHNPGLARTRRCARAKPSHNLSNVALLDDLVEIMISPLHHECFDERLATRLVHHIEWDLSTEECTSHIEGREMHANQQHPLMRRSFFSE